MNEWVEANDIEVVNVETLLLPNIHQNNEEGPPTRYTARLTLGKSPSIWFQVLRVWYRD